MRASNAHAHEMALRVEDAEEKNAQLLSYIAKMEAKLNFYALPAVTPPVVRASTSGLSVLSSMVCAGEVVYPVIRNIAWPVLENSMVYHQCT